MCMNINLFSKLTGSSVFGKAFYDDHPIFKSAYTPQDEVILRDYITGLQIINTIHSNLHSEDPYYFKSSPKQGFIRKFTRSEIPIRTVTAMINQPSDPLTVTATYVLYPEQYSVLLHVKVHNTSGLDMYNVSVEVGTDGPFQLFEKTLQVSFLKTLCNFLLAYTNHWRFHTKQHF